MTQETLLDKHLTLTEQKLDNVMRCRNLLIVARGWLSQLNLPTNDLYFIKETNGILTISPHDESGLPESLSTNRNALRNGVPGRCTIAEFFIATKDGFSSSAIVNVVHESGLVKGSLGKRHADLRFSRPKNAPAAGVTVTYPADYRADGFRYHEPSQIEINLSIGWGGDIGILTFGVNLQNGLLDTWRCSNKGIRDHIVEQIKNNWSTPQTLASAEKCGFQTSESTKGAVETLQKMFGVESLGLPDNTIYGFYGNSARKIDLRATLRANFSPNAQMAIYTTGKNTLFAPPIIILRPGAPLSYS